ncbi:MAG: FkbM family methyltransferase [Bacteriovoracia bacterium]
MASVNSVTRRVLKPVIKKMLGGRGYSWFHRRAKLRDIRYRLVEEPEMAILPWFVRSGDHVLDIGANFGYYTSRLSALCGSGKVHAFEPIPSTAADLAAIVHKLRLKNVELHSVGVGERNGIVEFELPLQDVGTPSAGQAHISGRDNSGMDSHYSFKKSVKVRCQVAALDSAEWRERIARVAFIKIDIEGAEYFALKGMAALLGRDQPVVLMEICPLFLAGFKITPESLHGLIADLGYRTFSYDTDKKLLVEQRGADYRDGNYILIHENRLGEFTSRIFSGSAGSDLEKKLDEARSALRKIFSGPDYRRAHVLARPVLAQLGADASVLRGLLKKFVLSAEFRRGERINPVVAIPMIEDPAFTLVANIWIPRPDGRTDISHQSIHHHGNLLLTSLAAYGPGYESILFDREERGLKISQIYTNELGKIEFVDSQVPHLVFYPSALSVTYALWSKDRPYRLNRLRRLPPSWKGAARKAAGALRLSGAIGFNQQEGFDYTVKNGAVVPLKHRALYEKGSHESLLAAMRFVAREVGLTDDEIWNVLGRGGTVQPLLFDPLHLFLPDANLLKAEVLACFP